MIKDINKVFTEFWDLQKRIDEKENWFDGLSWETFVRLVSMRNLRSRGVDIEKWVIEKNKWETVKQSEQRGDAKYDGNYIEVKSSIVTPLKKSSITLRGVRNWEHIDDFCFIVIDYRNYKENKIPVYVFRIWRHEFEEESTKHGLLKGYSLSKKANQANQNIPLGITMKIGDENFNRWVKRYTIRKVNL